MPLVKDVKTIIYHFNPNLFCDRFDDRTLQCFTSANSQAIFLWSYLKYMFFFIYKKLASFIRTSRLTGFSRN